MSRHPSVKWAQRFDKLFITVELPDAQDVKLKLEPEGKFTFSATSGPDKIPYEVDLDLLDKVNVEESKASIGSRNICYLVKKAEDKWWSRLIKQPGKPPLFLTVDWDKWVDEDEESETTFTPPGMDFDFNSLNLGGAGAEGFDGVIPDEDDDDDSDTEDDNAEEVSSLEKKEVPSAEIKEAAPSASSEPEANKV